MNTTAALLSQGAAHYAAGRHAQAETAARAALAVAPGDFGARHLLAACRIAQGALEEGAAGLEAVLAAVPEAARDEVLLQLAALRARQGHNAAVVALLAPVLEQRPGLQAAYRPLAAAHWALGARDAAIALWRGLVARRPDDGEAHRALGDALRQNGMGSEAIATLRHAEALLAGGPSQLAARIGLAEALADAAQAAPPGGAEDRAAAVAGHAALALGPADPASLLRIGAALLRAGDFAAATAVLARIDLADAAADAPAVLDQLGAAHTQLGNRAAAEAAFSALIARRADTAPDHAKAYLHRGILRLTHGDFAGGWPDYEWRRGRRAGQAAPWKVPARLDGQVVRVVAEQGLGDTVQFARYLPLLAARGAQVEVMVQAPLRPLLAAMPGIAGFVAAEDATPVPDIVLPMLSLPLAFATAIGSIPATVPYLAVPAARQAAWRARLGEQDRRPRVGLAWAGNPAFANDRRRSIPAARLAGLLRRDDVAFHVLADRLSAADAAAVAGRAVVHAGIADFADTAALVAEMDLVVAVDTAVAHLAGALGRSVWLLLPHCPDWRWLLGRDDSPWYPTARLFRQTAPGDWDSVLARVGEALDGRFR